MGCCPGEALYRVGPKHACTSSILYLGVGNPFAWSIRQCFRSGVSSRGTCWRRCRSRRGSGPRRSSSCRSRSGRGHRGSRAAPSSRSQSLKKSLTSVCASIPGGRGSGAVSQVSDLPPSNLSSVALLSVGFAGFEKIQQPARSRSLRSAWPSAAALIRMADRPCAGRVRRDP
jgi:hypothetical protein